MTTTTPDIDGDLLPAVDAIVASTGGRPDALIPILQALQGKYNYLPAEALRRVVETTEIDAASITGVASFYTQFRTRPCGRHRVKVCVGTACHVKGANRVYDEFRKQRGIPEDDDTDPGRLFTVEKVACLGCCMLAPVVQIDDVTYGHLEPAGVPRILDDFLAADTSTKRRAGAGAGPGKATGEIRLCLCSSCVAAGAHELAETCREILAVAALPARIKVVGCTGASFQAPVLEIRSGSGQTFRYAQVRPEDVRALLLRHLQPLGMARRIRATVTNVLEHLLTDAAWEPVTRYPAQVRDPSLDRYTERQVHIATENSGHLDPLDLGEYRAHGGFEALDRCLATSSPYDVIDTLACSGLRGRGGAGFPTARKWANVLAAEGGDKVVICNGDEGDPGAFMDRMLLESCPFRVIEGLAIAAFAVGAREGIFYIRAEYPLATRRVRLAIERCRDQGLLQGERQGEPWSLDLRVAEGAGAFVCGEETALIAALEGRRGMPCFRPPYPSERGFQDRPTLVNNAETLSLVPWILRHGSEAFSALGTAQSKGTKTFALAGRVVHGGLIEVPMGMTLKEIVFDIGGGIQDGRRFKAVQVGGPSGGCVPAHLAETPVDYESLGAAGAIMGSGGMIVLDEGDCMVDLARYFLAFTQEESCGKCVPCRVGTKRMLEILERLCDGRGGKKDLEHLEQLAAVTTSSSLCGLGRTAPNPVLSTLQHFREEFDAHVAGHCPAGVCKGLIRYSITDRCIGCTRCAQHCPVEAIPLTPYRKHVIDQDLCTKCNRCLEVCPEEAVVVR